MYRMVHGTFFGNALSSPTHQVYYHTKGATRVSCAYETGTNGLSPYATAILKKHALQRKLELIDKSIQRNYTIALEVCDKYKSIDEQYECKKMWDTIEGMSLVKISILKELLDVDDYLKERV